uniref:Ribosomal protein L28 n=1 Tax=Dunaliella tertiolecta TaxID=3047 RepID=A0A7S3QJM9_DUNTE|mmetsp:Transcript_5984/g.15922  ORF Transcript_5984/g.15922 Transcript_5984/m.15922 type:complete len:190 (-) Transcript_5984:527-1096(-)
MAFREKLFVAASRAAKEGQQHGLPPNLHADAKLNLSKILEKRRNTFWGETPILFRSRKYKFGGEVRDERVAVIKPHLHTVKLHSLILNKKVEIQTTPQMLRYIEALGGLDDYLLQTPDPKLNSDVASTMKWRITQLYQAKGLSSGAQLIMERKKELDAARAAESKKMLQGQPKVQEGAAGQAKVQQKSS